MRVRSNLYFIPKGPSVAGGSAKNFSPWNLVRIGVESARKSGLGHLRSLPQARFQSTVMGSPVRTWPDGGLITTAMLGAAPERELPAIWRATGLDTS